MQKNTPKCGASHCTENVWSNAWQGGRSGPGLRPESDTDLASLPTSPSCGQSQANLSSVFSCYSFFGFWCLQWTVHRPWPHGHHLLSPGPCHLSSLVASSSLQHSTALPSWPARSLSPEPATCAPSSPLLTAAPQCGMSSLFLWSLDSPSSLRTHFWGPVKTSLTTAP